jgi:hypothetical protein
MPPAPDHGIMVTLAVVNPNNNCNTGINVAKENNDSTVDKTLNKTFNVTYHL